MTKRMIIEVEVSDETTPAALALLLRDARGNFCAPRRNVVAYVDTNYSWMSMARRVAKVHEVTRRVAIADALVIMDVREAPPKDDGGIPGSPPDQRGWE